VSGRDDATAALLRSVGLGMVTVVLDELPAT
jgi:hypothetical protein